MDYTNIVDEKVQSMTTIKELEVIGVGFTERAEKEQSSDDNKIEVPLIDIRSEDKTKKKIRSLSKNNV